MLIYPFKGSYPLTQKFNDVRYRSSYTKFGLLGHNGMDWGMAVGTPLFAPHDGIVKETGVYDQYGYGYYIKIQNDVEGSVIAHMRERSLFKDGATVKQGELIGYSGNTGNSTGAHFHWGYWREPRDRENGFNGFMDQTYWMNIGNIDNSCQSELSSANEKIELLGQQNTDMTNILNKIKEIIK